MGDKRELVQLSTTPLNTLRYIPRTTLTPHPLLIHSMAMAWSLGTFLPTIYPYPNVARDKQLV